MLNNLIEKRKFSLAMKLLREGADPRETNYCGMNALHHACIQGHLPLIRRIIDAGVKVNRRTEYCSGLKGAFFPLHLSVLSGKFSVVEYLLEHGANINSISDDNETALHLAITIEKDRIARILIKRGSKLNMKGKNPDYPGQTPLHLAASQSRSLCELLIESGANINQRDSLKRTPLHYAVLGKESRIVSLFLTAGAKVDERDAALCTPLHLAVIQNSGIIVKQLLKAGASPLKKNEEGQTPADLTQNPKIQNLILSAGGRKSPPISADLLGFLKEVPDIAKSGRGRDQLTVKVQKDRSGKPTVFFVEEEVEKGLVVDKAYRVVGVQLKEQTISFSVKDTDYRDTFDFFIPRKEIRARWSPHTDYQSFKATTRKKRK